MTGCQEQRDHGRSNQYLVEDWEDWIVREAEQKAQHESEQADIQARDAHQELIAAAVEAEDAQNRVAAAEARLKNAQDAFTSALLIREKLSAKLEA